MRYSDNIEVKGIVKDGFNYTLQVWIKDYIIQNCGHKVNFGCNCNGRKYKGQDIRTLSLKRSRQVKKPLL